LGMRLDRFCANGNIGAIGGGLERDRKTDAARAAGDEKRLPLQRHDRPRKFRAEFLDDEPSKAAVPRPEATKMQLSGVHHLTAVSADAPGNVRFYTKVLGLRLVKKTVNQDDVSAYHLFYADGLASPGSDITFFDFPTLPEKRGNNTITHTGMRVAGEANLRWWRERLLDLRVPCGEVEERDGRLTLDFQDHENQRLALVDDGGKGEAHPWEKSPVPKDKQIRGLGPIIMTVPDLKPTDIVL